MAAATTSTDATVDAATKPTVEDDDEVIVSSKKPKKEEGPSPEEVHQDMLRKYKSASDVVHKSFQYVVNACVEGASVLKLCSDGDEQITKLVTATYTAKVNGAAIPRGIAFPTCISVNNVVSHFSPVESDPITSSQILVKGDVVKIQLGAHVDGFAVVQTETLIVGATAQEPATGRQADVVKAAWHAAQVAIRQLNIDEKNFTITDSVGKVAADWGCKPVEGMLSCLFSKNSVDGKKRIIQNPTPEQRSSHEKATFAENEVYGIDVLVVSHSDGKCASKEARTTVFQRVEGMTYQLKLKTSRAAISEVAKKAYYFPFTIRSMEDEKKARMGLHEAEKHGVVRPYEITYTPKDTYVASFMYTVMVTPEGPVLISQPPVWYSPDKLKTESELANDDMKKLLEAKVAPLTAASAPGGGKRKRPKKKKAAGAKAAAAEEEGSDE